MKFTHKLSLYAALMLSLVACRQPIDIDTDRTRVATNLPEITGFSPRIIQRGDRVTVIGKNFINVRKVLLDTLELDSVIVNSPNSLSAGIRWRNSLLPTWNYLTQRASKLSVITRTGIAESEQLLGVAEQSIAGYISSGNKPLDSVIVIAVHEQKKWNGQAVSGVGNAPRSPGFFGIQLVGINIGSPYYLALPGADFKVRPFLSGYSFTPTERTVIIENTLRPDTTSEFTATPMPSASIPEIQSVIPISGTSSSGNTDGGTTIMLRGKGFDKVRKIMIGTPYTTSFGRPSITVDYTEATNFRIENDNQLQFRLPSLDRTKALSGRTYADCQIYLLLENGSVLVPQRISIRYI
ncbi:MAG: IPT/TIG domain-containing protein [Candidatus Kapabacteria bacterium]|jgi:hypothetical protein|nr:IPT/TIG domain-containing protein [Candidatus Kapabacteria bacterium]